MSHLITLVWVSVIGLGFFSAIARLLSGGWKEASVGLSLS
jgi:hypothetical protein